MLRICAFRRPPAGLVQNGRGLLPFEPIHVNDSGFEPDACLDNSPCISLQIYSLFL
jgi:hypothetical protein